MRPLLSFYLFSFFSLDFLVAIEVMEEQFIYNREYALGKPLKIKVTNGNYTLKLLKEKHKPFLESLHTSSEAMRSFMYYGKARSKESFQKMFQQWKKKVEDNIPFTAYTFWNRDEKKFIGYVGFDHSENGALEVCYAIMPGFWNKGYGSTILSIACTALINFLKEEGYLKSYNITNLIAHVSDNNFASFHILKKNGFYKIDKSKGDDSPSNWVKLKRNL